MTNWILFALTAFLWGSSFYWIKVALEEIGPFALVAWRLFFAVAGLFALMKFRRKRFPPSPRDRWSLVVLSVLTPGIPFLLIAWAETRVDSTVASVLNGTIPLFTILIGHLALHDERITAPRLAGLLVGFTGVLVLFGRGLSLGSFAKDAWGLAACLVAEFLYGASVVYSRRYLRDMSPIVQSTALMLGGSVLIWGTLPVFETTAIIPLRPLTWLAVAWMGVLNSCVAFILFFRLLNAWGATRAAVVNYVVPAVGLAMGIWLRGEQADWRLILGSALIIGAVFLVNFKRRASRISLESQPQA